MTKEMRIFKVIQLTIDKQIPYRTLETLRYISLYEKYLIYN